MPINLKPVAMPGEMAWVPEPAPDPPAVITSAELLANLEKFKGTPAASLPKYASGGVVSGAHEVSLVSGQASPFPDFSGKLLKVMQPTAILSVEQAMDTHTFEFTLSVPAFSVDTALTYSSLSVLGKDVSKATVASKLKELAIAHIDTTITAVMKTMNLPE